ncbi:hypothetical protein [Mycobacteroides abscessus]|uniref:hypothetical protein n=1 Tax=Mycobacteroides abscessus TaxID=36809 RepID=UPI00094076B6|nr:hypothetical protein [Mycobacteroides abscessus]
MNNDAIGDAAQSSMQQKFDTDAHFKPYHLQVTHITVVNAQANSYKGVANVRTQDGVDHQVGIDVTYDGQTVLWQSPPGAFLFLADEKPKP